MLTNRSIRLHSKALNVLEAIQTLNNRIATHEADLKSDWVWLVSTREHFRNRVVIDKAIARRLERFYNRLLIQISQVVINEAEKELHHV